MIQKQKDELFDLTRKFTKEQEEWIDAFVAKLPDTDMINVITYNGGHGAFKDIKFAADIKLTAPNDAQFSILIRDDDIRITNDWKTVVGKNQQLLVWMAENYMKIVETYRQHLKEHPFEEVFGQEKETEKERER